MLRVYSRTGRAALSGNGARRLLSETWRILLIPLLLLLASRLVLEPFRVEGPSMAPTYRDQQLLLVNRLAYAVGAPQRGEVIVFRWPGAEKKNLIKRVIGVPGDQVLITQGRVLVNGRRLDEAYVQFGTGATYRYPSDGLPLNVPDQSFFVLGDNRPESADSRSGWLVPAQNVIGEAWLSYWTGSLKGGSQREDEPVRIGTPELEVAQS